MKFQDDISNMNTYIHTDKPKPICPPLFQSWGHNHCSGFRPGPTQIRLYSTAKKNWYRLEILDLESRGIAKTARLICVFVFAYAKVCFLMTRLIYTLH